MWWAVGLLAALWLGSFVVAVWVWLALLLITGVVLAGQFAVLPWVNRAQAYAALPAAKPRPPRAGQLVRAWWAEWRLVTRLGLGRMAWWPQATPLGLQMPQTVDEPTTGPKRPVLLVHGFVCNHAFWADWAEELLSRGHPVQAVDLEPVFGSIDEYAPIVDAAVRGMVQRTGLAPVLVGHSMGGLAIRAWLRQLRQMPGEQTAWLPHRVITLGSPHHGTELANWSWQPGMVNAHQMRFGSAWLRELAASESTLDTSRFTCFYSPCDNIVTPANTACLAGADNRVVEHAAHIELAFDAGVMEQTLALIELA